MSKPREFWIDLNINEVLEEVVPGTAPRHTREENDLLVREVRPEIDAAVEAMIDSIRAWACFDSEDEEIECLDEGERNTIYSCRDHIEAYDRVLRGEK